MSKNFFRILVPAMMLLNGCSKDETVAPLPVLKAAKGIYVLSEGSGSNNSKLGFYNIESGTFNGDFFRQQNGSDLGQIANDMIQYGSKIYIIMNASSNVTVVNASTAMLLKRIDMVNGVAKRFPRYATAYKANVFVSATDGTVSVIDTTTLSIVKTIPVGAHPEGLAVAGNYLYVANSGGYNAVPDSTVSVVDLNSLAEIKKIIIGTKNPQRVEVNSAGDVYVSGYGNFTSIPASVSVINSANMALKSELGSGYSYPFFRLYHDVAYFYNNYGGSGTAKVYNTVTNTLIRSEFVTDGSLVSTPYGLNIDDENGDVYIMDAKDYSSSGSVICFDKDGKKKFSFSVVPGVNPNKVIFIR
jgi:YVTN family beta-propeller protein